MLFDFANVAVFFVFSLVFVSVMLTLQRFLAPRAPTYEKETPYECGEVPIGTPWIRFNPRYYLVALVFLIFDVEIAFIYPCAVVFRNWVERGSGWAALIEIFTFLGILVIGLVYAWKRGFLEWVKTVQEAESR